MAHLIALSNVTLLPELYLSLAFVGPDGNLYAFYQDPLGNWSNAGPEQLETPAGATFQSIVGITDMLIALSTTGELYYGVPQLAGTSFWGDGKGGPFIKIPLVDALGDDLTLAFSDFSAAWVGGGDAESVVLAAVAQPAPNAFAAGDNSFVYCLQFVDQGAPEVGAIWGPAMPILSSQNLIAINAQNVIAVMDMSSTDTPFGIVCAVLGVGPDTQLSPSAQYTGQSGGFYGWLNVSGNATGPWTALVVESKPPSPPTSLTVPPNPNAAPAPVVGQQAPSDAVPADIMLAFCEAFLLSNGQPSFSVMGIDVNAANSVPYESGWSVWAAGGISAPPQVPLTFSSMAAGIGTLSNLQLVALSGGLPFLFSQMPGGTWPLFLWFPPFVQGIPLATPNGVQYTDLAVGMGQGPQGQPFFQVGYLGPVQNGVQQVYVNTQDSSGNWSITGPL